MAASLKKMSHVRCVVPAYILKRQSFPLGAPTREQVEQMKKERDEKRSAREGTGNACYAGVIGKRNGSDPGDAEAASWTAGGMSQVSRNRFRKNGKTGRKKPENG